MIVIGRKIGMSHIFNEHGHMVPVTLMICVENVVGGHRMKDVHGYNAVQVATRGSKHVSQPIQKQLEKVNIKLPLGVMREFRVTPDEFEKFPLGSEINLDRIKPGDRVTVTAISKGKGFAGTIKRHRFSRGPKTHGSDNYRRPGSIGSQEPQRVIKGKRMAGHLGVQRTTISNIRVMSVDDRECLIALAGSIPGPNRGLVEIRTA